MDVRRLALFHGLQRFWRKFLGVIPQFCSQRLDRDLQRPRSAAQHHRTADRPVRFIPTFARAQNDIPKMWPDGCVHSTSRYGLPPSLQRACRLCVFVDASGASTPRRGGQSCEQGLASSDWHLIALAIPAVPCKPMISTLSGSASATYFSCTEPRTRHPEKSYPGDRLGPNAQEAM
jgi:hypothetical protein